MHVHIYVYILYIRRKPPKLLPQPRLAILALINAKEDALVMIAMKCSSFCSVNVGTSGRSAICGLGNVLYRSVREANLMMSRLLARIAEHASCFLKALGRLRWRALCQRYAQDHFTHLRGGGSWVGMDSRATSAIYGEVPPSFSRNEAAPVS